MTHRTLPLRSTRPALAWLAGACGSAGGPTAEGSGGRVEEPRAGDPAPPAAGSSGDAPAATPAGGGWTVAVVTIEYERQPDGGRYPNYVKESYRLQADGTLDYSACFGVMPIEMNHMDGLLWDSGEAGRAARASRTRRL